MRTPLLSIALLIPLLGLAQRPLAIRGQVHAAYALSKHCDITLMTNCGDTLLVERPRSGRFNYRVPHNTSYVLRFAEEGSITKEVVVDASELPTVRKKYRVRRIEFDVMMEQGDPGEHWRYARPVGFIGFRRGSGTMQVFYEDGNTVEAADAR